MGTYERPRAVVRRWGRFHHPPFLSLGYYSWLSSRSAPQLGWITDSNIESGRFICTPCVTSNVMSQDQSQGDAPDYSQLNVYAGPELCDVRNMTVYADAYLPLLGSDPGIHAKIIGSSHYIRMVGDLPEYNEITSCRPIMMAKDFDPVTHNFTIPEGIRTEIHREVGRFDVTVTVATVDFLTPIPEKWDLWYSFGGEKGVPTAIRTHDTGWETYHGYDEFNVDVWTYTEITER